MRSFGAFHAGNGITQIFVVGIGVPRVEVAAFFGLFKQLFHGLRMQKGISAGIFNGWIHATVFAKVLQILNAVCRSC